VKDRFLIQSNFSVLNRGTEPITRLRLGFVLNLGSFNNGIGDPFPFFVLNFQVWILI